MSKKKNKRRFCDPEMCCNCMYIGEGDFVCEKYLVIVVDEWGPTDDYMKCVTDTNVGGKGGAE